MNDDLVKMAKVAGIAKHGLGWTCWEGQLERFAALVTAASRKPLSEQQIMEIEKRVHFHESPDWPVRFARELERAHGIGGEE